MSTPPVKILELSFSDSCETIELEGKLEDEVMIAASEPRAYVPFGRSISRNHPGQDGLPQQKDLVSDHDVPLAAFKDVSLREGPERESWQIRDCTDAGDCEEELYFKDRVVVWSKGCGYSTSTVQKSFTLQDPVLQVEWSRFRIQRHKQTDTKPSLAENNQEDVAGISITHPASITVFTEAGEKFVASLPFQVSKTWIVDGGMLLEQAVSQTELASVFGKREKEKLPTLFSLLHPLDEPTPVLCRSGSSGNTRVSFVTDPMQQIVFTSQKPSLVMTFDRSIGVHSVWALRKVKEEEANTAVKLLDVLSGSLSLHSSMANTTGLGATPKHHSTSSTASLLAGLSMSAQSRLSMSSISPAMSPAPGFRGYARTLASPHLASRGQSPALSHSGVNRSYSPGHSLPFLSPGVSQTPRSSYPWTPGAGTTNDMTTMCEDIDEPLLPELCLEHCWTEPFTANRDGILGQASKAFLTSDLSGQDFLCFLLPRYRQLRCLKFNSSNDCTQLIFGSLTTLHVRDAVQLEDLKMMAVVEANGNLALYTGINKVGNILLPGVAPTIMASSVGPGGTTMPRPSTPLDSPYLTSSHLTGASPTLNDEVGLLSPVPGEVSHTKLQESTCSEDLTLSHSATSGQHVVRLQDPVKNRFTVVLSNETMIRTSLPKISVSNTVNLCLEAVKYVLPRDTAIQFQAKWYSTNHAPGEIRDQSELMTFVTCLLNMMGYNTEQLNLYGRDTESSGSPGVAAKKHKPSGWDEDWEYLFSSDYHSKVKDNFPAFGHPDRAPSPSAKDTESSNDPATNRKPLESSALLFTQIPGLAFVLHLVYEELKLNKFSKEDVKELVVVLNHLACELDWCQYQDYYLRNHPNLFSSTPEKSLTPEMKKDLQVPTFWTPLPPSIHRYLYNYIRGAKQDPFPVLSGLCTRTSEAVSLYMLCKDEGIPDIAGTHRLSRRQSVSAFPSDLNSMDGLNAFLLRYPDLPPSQRTVVYMSQLGYTLATLNSFPVGVALPLMEAISQSRDAPPSSWPKGAYDLLCRQDLSNQVEWLSASSKKHHRSKMHCGSQGLGLSTMATKQEERDGMEHLDQELLRLRFPDDLRVQEVRRLLQSSKPVTIALTQKPETSDHEFIEEQELHLLLVSQRTMALPVGRGIFTLCTSNAIITEPLHIPKLNLTGKAPPRNNTINFVNIDVPTNMNAWPLFHNGVAAGLKIARGDNQIDSAWIVYNRPQTTELANEHAGFLMALGLNGHLSNLDKLNIHNYLCSGHEMTSVGLLLGLAAAKRGTMDVTTTKILCIHISSLLPPTSTELDVPHSVQVAAILGTGLVYQKTAHRHVAEVLLGEIGRPPGPELSNCTNRESYSLAAGLALGMVTLGRGSGAVGLSDLNIPDQLYHYMAGGHKKNLSGHNREKKSPCYQIREGDQVNLDVTSPGATLALGLMFLQTGNRAVADWLAAPDTQSLLDMVKPDFLLLRAISRGLVLWDDIRPTCEWVDSNIPPIVKKYAFKANLEESSGEEGIEYQTLSQAICNIGAGACFVLGLRFAGTANKCAYECLLSYLKKLMNRASQSLVDVAGRTTYKTCLYTILLASAMVMAGTGDIELLRVARGLRSRVHNDISYGNHMACSMAIGLLFMGGGRYTLSTSQESVAALVTSLFPCFPGNSKGNRYHLQALRHLYVLAAEPRLILPKDVGTGKPCYVPLEVTLKESEWHDETILKLMAPCIIGELSTLKRVRIVGPRYLGVTLDLEHDLETLKGLLTSGGTLFVKQRAGHLSYAEDPKGYRSLLAQLLTHETSNHSTSDLKLIESFTSDPYILTFVKQFCWWNSDKPKQEDEKSLMMGSLLFESVTKEKLSVLPVLLELHQSLEQPLESLDASDLWQLKLVLAYYSHHPAVKTPVDKSNQTTAQRRRLVHAEACAHFKSRLDSVLDTWLQAHSSDVLSYLQSGALPTDGKDRAILYVFLHVYDIAHSSMTSQTALQVTGDSSLPEVYTALKDYQLPMSTVLRIYQCLQRTR
ncbi:anaphase-promoting complex subunit 1-like isoform X2 [Lytechinus pictus]|uniref:anaphase-promoting complex subunit 1-like isoform X2 n=1 Tax=Lytechinus pictus TaxID=7653 RepID=UPI0030BA20BD